LDGKKLFSGGTDDTIRVWDMQSHSLDYALTGHAGTVYDLCLSPDGNQLVSAGSDQTIRLWDWRTQKELRKVHGHDGWVLSVAFSPDGKIVASGGRDEIIRLWDAGSLREVKRLEGHRTWDVAFSTDGKILASGGHGLILWDAQTGRRLRQLTGHRGSIRALVFDPKNQRLLTGSEDRTLRLWDIQSGNEVHMSVGHQHDVISAAASRDNKYLITSSSDGEVIKWSRDTGQPVSRIANDQNEVCHLACRKNGSDLVAVSARSRTIYDIGTGTCISKTALTNRNTYCRSVTSDPYGEVIAVGDDDGTIRIFDTDSPNEVTSLGYRTGRQPVCALANSSNGIMVAGANTIGEIDIWCEAGRRKLRTLGWAGFEIALLSFSRSGNFLFSYGRDRSFAWGGRIWSLGNDTSVPLPDFPTPIGSAQFCPSNRILAVGSKAGQVYLVEVLTGRQIAILEGHRGPVRSLLFLDSTRLVSTSSDTSILIWNVPKALGGTEVFRNVAEAWQALGSATPSTAYAAARHLSEHPDLAIKHIEEAVRSYLSTDLTALIKSLDSDDPVVREQAYGAIQDMIVFCGSRIKSLPRDGLTAEALDKLRMLLGSFDRSERKSGVLRIMRCLFVLEDLHSQTAGKLLSLIREHSEMPLVSQEGETVLTRTSFK
jgi:WD40 repeat protein